ncbi:MAG: OmpA family protein [Planctomycetaceae bacterium]|nr:OmpA family protein [Planctomycetaceae bacterium]
MSTPPITPPPSLPPPKTDMSEQHSAFRPILPEMFVPPLPGQELLKTEPKQEVIIVQPSIVSPTIDELNRRILELEAELKEVRQAPPPVTFDNLLVSEMLALEPPSVRPVRSLPIIDKKGVRVYTDEAQQPRIEVPDEVLFMPNSWQLTADGEETLRVIAAELRAFDSMSVLDIEGHTDSLMGDPNNPMQKHEISWVKTKVVMDFFVDALRWDTARIGVSSFGRSRPIADNGTPEGRARNNRIEIVIRDAGE